MGGEHGEYPVAVVNIPSTMRKQSLYLLHCSSRRALHAFAMPGLGSYDEETTNDAQRRALALIESLIK
jgi:hypothetical protein